VAHGLVARLAQTGLTLATAESCTGGLIARMITAIPGVSAHYQGGVVSYANLAKTELLGVPAVLIESHGAVSPEVAAAMAEGVRSRLSADLGVSTTGVAGPGGGSPEKPVGLVYIGLASTEGTKTRRFEIGPEQPREVIQWWSAKAALNWARLSLIAE
jgi:nicotinamide-nucleotide amidase